MNKKIKTQVLALTQIIKLTNNLGLNQLISPKHKTTMKIADNQINI